MKRLSVTPGLTCIWQVSGRSEVGFEEWVRMDIRYCSRPSPLQDLVILLRTVPAVLSAGERTSPRLCDDMSRQGRGSVLHTGVGCLAVEMEDSILNLASAYRDARRVKCCARTSGCYFALLEKRGGRDPGVPQSG